MNHELTLPQPVLFVLWRLQTAGHEAYIVGGAVRDTIMQRRTHDWDFTTNATPEQIQVLFEGSFYTNEYGTVGLPGGALFAQMKQSGWQMSREREQEQAWLEEVLEVTTFRTEFGYSDNRRPDVVAWGNSIEEDLARRDFTINAIALTPAHGTQAPLSGMEAFAQKRDEISLPMVRIDPYKGIEDIEKKMIRAVRDPQERFSEDALRMMRAIRFGAQLHFGIEAQTLLAIQAQAKLITQISWERIRDELLKILASDYPAEGITLLSNAGLLEYILPELLPMKGVKQGGHHIYDVWTHSLESLKECPSTDPIVRLATLLHDVGKPRTYREQGPRGVTFYGHEVVGARMAEKIGKRLRLSGKQMERLLTLVRWHMFVYNPEMTDAAIRRFIKRVGLDNINDMMLLRVGDRKGGGSKATSWRLRELQERIGEQLYEPLSLKDLAIDGADVMDELEIAPGPIIGTILNQLFEEVMEETHKNTREYLLKRMREIFEEITAK
jgi:tRNA nucleotidyltransferase (CCA-adding enzyme)